jgi:N-methylhydantoinase A
LVIATASRLTVLNAGLDELAGRAEQWLKSEGMSNGDPDVAHRWQLDLRYAGQNAELILDIDDARLDQAGLDKAIQAYHARHVDLYGYDMPAQPVEVVNLRVSVIIARGRIDASTQAPEGEVAAALHEHPTRPVWFASTGFVPTPVIQRENLACGSTLRGPAIIEQMDTTTVIPPGSLTHVDDGGYLHIDLTPDAGGKEGKQ